MRSNTFRTLACTRRCFSLTKVSVSYSRRRYRWKFRLKEFGHGFWLVNATFFAERRRLGLRGPGSASSFGLGAYRTGWRQGVHIALGSGCCQNPAHFFFLVRLDQQIIGTALKNLSP